MIQKLILPNYVKDFMNVFKKAKYEIYIVGGAVRDMILERPIKNWDFATNAKPAEILSLFKNAKYENQYGTVIVPLETKNIVMEITPYRKESKYSDKRHPDKIEWAKTIKEDIMRRDFTINAIAYDGNRIVDITGGIEDISKKIIRTVGDPDKRFCEDALRLIRAIRLSSELGFVIEEKTRLSIKKNASLIKHISWERIASEFLKIISSPFPAEGILFLRNTGLLKFILPELDKCFSISQKSPKRHHIFDVGTHSVETLRNCPSKDPITRFAALIHDIGKKDAYKKDEKTGVITFLNHEHIGARLASQIADRFKLSKEQKNKLIILVRYHMFSISEKQTDKAIRRFIRNIGTENIDDMLSVRLGDRVGSGAAPTSWRLELFKKRLIDVQKIPFQIKDLKIDGYDVMKILNIKPGPLVGKVLSEIFKKVEEGKLKNEKKALIAEIKKMKE